MDNFRIDITAEGKPTLIEAVGIAFTHNAPGQKVESYEIVSLKPDDFNGMPKNLEGVNAMVMRWANSGAGRRQSAINLPFKLDAAGAADFVWRWLDEAHYQEEPDIDGHCKKGWRLFTGIWRHVDGDPYSVFAIIPAWAMYGK